VRSVRNGWYVTEDNGGRVVAFHRRALACSSRIRRDYRKLLGMSSTSQDIEEYIVAQHVSIFGKLATHGAPHGFIP
jgi:hypothetical protein